MRVPAALLAIGLAASVNAMAASVPDHAQMPAQKAFASVPKGTTQSCMAGDRLLSHAAYTPGAQPLRCSELLSTDTLMKIRRWSST